MYLNGTSVNPYGAVAECTLYLLMHGKSLPHRKALAYNTCFFIRS